MILEKMLNPLWKGIKFIGKMAIPLAYLANCEIPLEDLGIPDAEELACSVNMFPDLEPIDFIEYENDDGDLIQKVRVYMEDDSCSNNFRVKMREVLDGVEGSWKRYDGQKTQILGKDCTLGGYFNAELNILTPAIIGGEDLHYDVKIVDSCKGESNIASVYRMEDETDDDTLDDDTKRLD